MARILIVEDDAAIATSLANLLLGEGHTIEQAARQDDAIALLNSTHFDLALVDISLAQGNGFAVCAAAKSLPNIMGAAGATRPVRQEKTGNLAQAANLSSSANTTNAARQASATETTGAARQVPAAGTAGAARQVPATGTAGAVRQAPATGPSPAVIFLTASDDEFSTVAGLDMGADDYIAKPFRTRELLSRIRNVLRRASNANPVLALGNIRIDTSAATVRKNGCELALSALEYRLLLLFAQNPGKLVTREHARNVIWDSAGEYVSDNTLNVYIKRLRNKIEDDPAQPEIIQTVRGLGYKAYR